MRARFAGLCESLLVSAIAIAMALFAWLVVAAFGGLPMLPVLRVFAEGSFGSAFALEQTFRAATPLLLTGLAYALPAHAGLMVIGVEGAYVLGGLAAALCGLFGLGLFSMPVMLAGGVAAGAALVGACGALKAWRGVHEAISSLLLTYVAIAATLQLVEGVFRYEGSLDKPATAPIGIDAQIGGIGIGALHWGLPVGVAICVLAHIFIAHTKQGYMVRTHGANERAARFAGFPCGLIVVGICLASGALGGLAGAFEVGAVQHQASASLVQGYGYAGILVAMLARGNLLAIVVASVLVGALDSGGGMLQRQLGAPAATASLMQGLLFIFLVAFGTLRGKFARKWFLAGVGASR